MREPHESDRIRTEKPLGGRDPLAWRLDTSRRVTAYFYGHHWWLGPSLINRRDVMWATGIRMRGAT
jgi:hypothetical protein